MSSKSSATSPVRAPLPVRLRMRALEAVAPQRAAAVAERLWFAVPKAPTSSRLARFTPTGGAPFFLMSGESEIHGVTFGPEDGPVALLVHGWGGYWQQLAEHIPALVEAGHRVVCFDAPSHGRSTHGAEGPGCSSVLEIGDAVATILDEFGTPAISITHSAGAMALLRAERGRIPSGAYVLIAPQVRLEPAIDWFSGIVEMGPRTRAIFEERLRARTGMEAADVDMIADVRRMLAAGHCPPMLAVHDVDDPDAPIALTEQLVDAWSGSDLLTTNGLGHRQVIWNDEVLKRVGIFIHQLTHSTEVRRLHG